MVPQLMNKMKYAQAGTLIDDNMYFTNGINSSSTKAKSSKKIYSYNLKTGVFLTSQNDLIYGRKRSYKLFNYKKKLYILGGKNDEFNGTVAIEDVIELQIID